MRRLVDANMTAVFSFASLGPIFFRAQRSLLSLRWPAKIRNIFNATRTHALNLAKFVTIYKLLLLLQRKLNGGKERDMDTFVAGGLGGWWVFGERTAVS